MLGIVVSRADRASEHIGEHCLAVGEFESRTDDLRPDAEGGGTYHVGDEVELRTFDELHLHTEDIAAAFDDPDLVAFASKHSGETGPLLSAHFTGNFGPAEFGGEDGRLAAAAPNAHARVLSAFEEYAPEGYEVTTECTHHGPSSVGCPSLFVEVGSGEPEWDDPDAARAAARAILSLRGVDPHTERTVVGFGGGHYAPRFGRIARETDWAVGHVGADWTLDAMGDPDPGVIRRAFEQSNADRAVIDGEYPDLEATVESLGYEVVSETWIRAVDGRPLDLVEAVEDRLGPVEDGVRFGEADPGSPGSLVVLDLPLDLLAEAQGIDPDRTREAVESHAVAFRTREGATRATDRAAFPDRDAHDALVDGLAEVLREKYDEVRREDGEVVAVETAFDPDLAREAGVDPGPDFGKLADGVAVIVDGDRVDPGEAHREVTRRFPARASPGEEK